MLNINSQKRPGEHFSINRMSVDNEKTEINPQQLYHILLLVLRVLSYTGFSYLPSLFDTKLLMQLPDKADLQNGLVKKAPMCVTDVLPVGVKYVIDGGVMLQHLPLPKFARYAELCTFTTTSIVLLLCLMVMEMILPSKMNHIKEKLVVT